MYADLARGKLGSGDQMTVGVVYPPAPEWAPVLRHLLGHKDPAQRSEIAGELDGALDQLSAAFYVGLVDGVPVTVARVAGGHGAGIWGHVYTVPAWRQRGASGLLHQAAAADMRRRGFDVLTLGTNPLGHARKLYAAIGFRPVAPNSGSMIWRLGQDPPAGVPTVGPLRWEDWGWISAAACAPQVPEEVWPRSRLFRVQGPRFVGGPFIEAMLAHVPLLVLRRGHRAVGWASPTGGEFYVRPECLSDRGALERAVAAATAR